jgi:23S rRNA (uridine2552-2'-O)-methyltransferase
MPMPAYKPRDRFHRMARERGLVSRAAFKLEEILARLRLDLSRARIIDLGAAPGGWLAILARAAGTDARIVGVDLEPCRAVPAGVVTIRGDIEDPAVAAEVARALGGPADLITSDLAPKLSGIKARDQVRAARLVDAALEFSARGLRPGGAMIVKLFMGGEFKEIIARFSRRFDEVRVMRTRATRPGSAELYLIARGFRPE